jgi:biopolymer transport protein ExbB
MVEGELLEALLTWHKDAFVAAANAISSGGPAMGVIAALSVVLLALVLWKLWRLARSRFWARAQAERAVTLWQSGARAEAAAIAGAGRGPRARVLAAAFAATGRLPDTEARLETARVAKRELAQARAGLRALELIALIAPLLGLLGTVLGMIEAFRQVQDSAGVADPAALAGGIWQALLTTAAGMAVAIPASVALTLFEALADGLRLDLEDLATRVFAATLPGAVERAPPRAAE